MSKKKTIAITTIILALAILVLANVWAGDRANEVTPLEAASVATAGLVSEPAHVSSQHLQAAQKGFFFTRVWHWFRYTKPNAI